MQLKACNTNMFVRKAVHNAVVRQLYTLRTWAIKRLDDQMDDMAKAVEKDDDRAITRLSSYADNQETLIRQLTEDLARLTAEFRAEFREEPQLDYQANSKDAAKARIKAMLAERGYNRPGMTPQDGSVIVTPTGEETGHVLLLDQPNPVINDGTGRRGELAE